MATPVTVYFLWYFLSAAVFCPWLFHLILPVYDFFRCSFLRPLPFPLPVCLLCYFLSLLMMHPWLLCLSLCVLLQEETDWQWRQAMDYLSAVSELNYMTQIVIMLYEDNDKVGGAFLLLPP